MMFFFSSSPDKPKYNFKGCARISSTVWFGFKDSSGFWKINWMALRSLEFLFFKSFDKTLSWSNFISL